MVQLETFYIFIECFMHYVKYVHTFLNEMWNSKTQHLDELHDIFSPQLIAISPLGSKIGADGLKNTNVTWSNGFPDMELCNIELISAGNIVIAEWRSQGTNMNAFNDYQPTGKKVDYKGVTIFQFDGQKVVRYKCIINMLDIYDQLGFFLEQESYDGQKIVRRNHALLLSKLKELTASFQLSSREIECISFFIHGWSAKQIALHLKCSYRTVQNHISSATDKFDCHSRSHLFEFLNVKGLIPLFEDLYKLCFNNYFEKKDDNEL